MKIAFSKCSGSDKYSLYYEWLRSNNSSIEAVDFYDIEPSSIPELFEDCSGLVLTGGSDVNPALYGMPEEFPRCHINLDRDETDFMLIDCAIRKKIPILAICRGMQILNVYLNGNLIVDIQQDTDSPIIHSSTESLTSEHLIFIDPTSKLFQIIEDNGIVVNSYHHQAVKIIGQGLKASAVSSDKIIEAVESDNILFQQFILGIQFHPELMDFDNIYTQKIARYFINECKNIL